MFGAVDEDTMRRVVYVAGGVGERTGGTDVGEWCETDELMLKKAPDRNVALSRERAAVDPVYPAALVSQGLAGSAQVKCRISAQGDVMSAEVVEASHPLFGEAAVVAVRQWKFAPAIIDHHYVEATVIVPVDFPAPAGSTAAKDTGKP
jgi:TonB family protein